ncbi:hypothetical protein [Leptolyngbya sp. 7M]|uniref:hypothetical protein n=1 Tax=Leptolyngbya sp. 7M TaxID=2812896 RepID=UPI001B8D2BB7|nr:hypothetical protein [Leptolyngbya sp. 7M]QYO64752.1 hypothetical protein JVX88_35040 [Leptolyngbya sp. 7M]
MKRGTAAIPISVLIASVMLHIVIPGIIALIFALFFLVLTVGEIIFFIAEILALFFFLQLINTLAGSGIFAIVSSRLMNTMEGWWKYPMVFILSLVMHFAVFGVVLFVYWLIFPADNLVWIVRYGWKITAIVAPFASLPGWSKPRLHLIRP